MKVVGDCFKALEKDCDRISVMTRVDYRAGNNAPEKQSPVCGRKTGTRSS